MRPKVLTAVIDANQIEHWFDDAHKRAPALNILSFAPYSYKSTDVEGELRVGAYMLVYLEMHPQPEMSLQRPVIQVPGIRKQ